MCHVAGTVRARRGERDEPEMEGNTLPDLEQDNGPSASLQKQLHGLHRSLHGDVLAETATPWETFHWELAQLLVKVELLSPRSIKRPKFGLD